MKAQHINDPHHRQEERVHGEEPEPNLRPQPRTASNRQGRQVEHRRMEKLQAMEIVADPHVGS